MTTEISKDQHSNRKIRSFVLRQGRLTKGQEHAIDNLWPIFGINYQNDLLLDFNQLFGNSNPVTLEIGFGMGSSLIEMANNAKNENFLGVEVHMPGIGACLMATNALMLTNLRVMNHDAVEILQNMVPDYSINKIQIFFPDPWHKSKHNKRRIIQPEFVTLLKQKLKPGGLLHLATDWQNYAEHMLDVLNNENDLINLSPNNLYIPRPKYRPITKFEKRGLNLGHSVWDLQFKRK